MIEHSSGFSLGEALDAQSLAACRELIEECGRMLPGELRPAAGELAGLPGAYARPSGRLLLARVAGEPGGCVALRRIGERDAEMKRLFVRPEYRGMGLGRMLAECAIDEARAIGYATVKLDTLGTMDEAHRLYSQMGFVEVAPYNHNPVPGVRFMSLVLG